jgi:hypothetical protein
MLLAREVLGPELAPDEPLAARPGEPVELHEFGDIGEAVAFLSDALRNLMAREPTASCCVIARHPEQADAYFAGLARAEIPALRRVKRDEFSFQPGVDITDVTQVKGLEFDYVIMVEVNAQSLPRRALGPAPAAHRRHPRRPPAVAGVDHRAVGAGAPGAARRRPHDRRLSGAIVLVLADGHQLRHCGCEDHSYSIGARSVGGPSTWVRTRGAPSPRPGQPLVTCSRSLG